MYLFGNPSVFRLSISGDIENRKKEEKERLKEGEREHDRTAY